jgi:hypothetical protein
MKAEDAYYLANAQASFDDWRRSRKQVTFLQLFRAFRALCHFRILFCTRQLPRLVRTVAVALMFLDHIPFEFLNLRRTILDLSSFPTFFAFGWVCVVRLVCVF